MSSRPSHAGELTLAAHRGTHKVGGVTAAELLPDTLAMSLHGAGADVEFSADGLVAMAGNYSRQNFLLALRKPVHAPGVAL